MGNKMNINPDKKMIKFIKSLVQRYNHEKYWKMRFEVINPLSKKPKIVRLYYLYLIKRSDAFNCASMGTDLGKGAMFKSAPTLPHGLNGIIIHHNAIVGYNATIFHQVTIAGDINRGGTAIIGDNCTIGSGAKIIGGVKIGNNVKIGANSVVINDIPDNCTVIGIPAIIVKKDGIKI